MIVCEIHIESKAEKVILKEEFADVTRMASRSIHSLKPKKKRASTLTGRRGKLPAIPSRLTAGSQSRTRSTRISPIASSAARRAWRRIAPPHAHASCPSLARSRWRSSQRKAFETGNQP